MKPASLPHLSGRITTGIILSLFFAVMIPTMPLHAQQVGSPVALGITKSKAATQHEIIMLLIRQKEYEKAATEAHKIFDMKWPEDQEPLLLRELLLISDQFLRHGQAPMGLKVIDRNSKCFKKTPSRIAILKEMGYLYKRMNQNDKAFDCFRKAQELEDKD